MSGKLRTWTGWPYLRFLSPFFFSARSSWRKNCRLVFPCKLTPPNASSASSKHPFNPWGGSLKSWWIFRNISMACSSFDKSIVFPISLLSAVFSARCGVVPKRSSLSEPTVPLLSLLPFFVDFPPRTFTGKDLLRLSTTMSSLANANGEERTGNGDLLAVLPLSSVICIAVWKSSIRSCLSSRMDGSLEAPSGGWLGRRFIWTSRAHTSFSRLQRYTRSSKCKHLSRSVPVATTIKRLPCTDWTSQDFVHKAKECVFFTKTMASYNNAGTIKVLWKASLSCCGW